MSRLTIDTGTEGNPATGDSLRGAFTKVNTNFEEIYNELGASGILSDLSFKDNIISTDNTNQNLILSPNGTGQVQIRSASCSGGFGFSGNILSTTDTNADMELDPSGTGNLILKSGNFLPATDNTQYLGSASKRWHSLYVGPGSIYVGDAQITSTGTTINLPSNTTIGGVNVTDQVNSSFTFVGDDSTGTTLNTGETFKIAGTQNITTAVSGDTLTITGPNLSSYITNSPLTVVGDDSTGTTLNTGETFKIAGAGGVTTAVSGDTLTITGSASAQGITFVGDDSTGTAVNTGETIKIAGTQNITTAVSGDTLTITGPNLSAYIESSFTIVTGDGSTTFSAVSNQRYGVNTSAGSITVNLPSAPATGDAIFFADAGGAFSTNNLTIGRNGNTIMGLSENMTISTNNSSTGLFYNGSTWRIYS
jgi:hypothetical protein